MVLFFKCWAFQDEIQFLFMEDPFKRCQKGCLQAGYGRDSECSWLLICQGTWWKKYRQWRLQNIAKRYCLYLKLPFTHFDRFWLFCLFLTIFTASLKSSLSLNGYIEYPDTRGVQNILIIFFPLSLKKVNQDCRLLRKYLFWQFLAISDVIDIPEVSFKVLLVCHDCFVTNKYKVSKKCLY